MPASVKISHVVNQHLGLTETSGEWHIQRRSVESAGGTPIRQLLCLRLRGPIGGSPVGHFNPCLEVFHGPRTSGGKTGGQSAECDRR